MKEVPEVALAVAVIQRAAYDLRWGSMVNKREAAQDVLSGGLEYWVDVVGVEYEVAERIRTRLRALALRAVPLAG